MVRRTGIAYEELETEAMLALCMAVDRYDPTKSSLSSYAIPYIQGKLLQYLRDKGHAIRLPQLAQSIGVKIRRLQNQHGGRIQAKKVCEILNISTNEYKEAQTTRMNSKLTSLNSRHGIEGDEFELQDLIVSPDYSGEAQQHLNSNWSIPLDKLGKRERELIELMWYQGKSFREVEALTGIGSKKARQSLRLAVLLLSASSAVAKLATPNYSELVMPD